MGGVDRRDFLKRVGAAGAVGGAAVIGAARLVAGAKTTDDTVLRTGPRPSRDRHASGLGAVGTVDHDANGFDPLEILDRLRRRRGIQGFERPHRSRVRVRRRSTKRSRSLPASSSPRGPTTGASPARRSGRPKAIASASSSRTRPSIRTRSTSTASIRRAMDGVPGVGEVDTGRDLHLRLHRRAVRHAPLPLPLDAAGAAHPPRPLRRVHRRSEEGPTGRQRDGDGDERVRHELRRRERGLRGEHRRVRLRERPDPDRTPASCSGCT